jgi:beta-glucosidase
VPAVLLGWFGGQEFGNALADVITGEREPGGRLPTTWAAQMSDLPVVDVTPVDGRLPYDEGIHIGYRAWLRSGVEPAYEFGAGLGYTTWSIGDAAVATADGDFVVTVPVTNTGDRHGKQVVQVYAARPDSSIERPARWLVGFAVVRAEAGATATAEVTIPRRAFAHWDGAWSDEPGRFDLLIGTTVTKIASRVAVEI